MILETIREQEEIPLEEVRAVAVSRDGVNVLMQEPGKKKGRKRQRSCERKTATEGEFDSPTSYKNAVVGSVTLYGAIPPDEVAPERLQSRYVAQMPENKAVTLKPIYGKNSEKGNKQFEEKKKILLEDANGAEKIYRSLKYFEENYKYSAEQDRILQAEITFFKNNKAYREYKRFRDEGLPIGSGVIEAACKSVVKIRFCRSGMRWSRTKGQAILTLRTILKSERWEQFWNVYKSNGVNQVIKSAA